MALEPLNECAVTGGRTSRGLATAFEQVDVVLADSVMRFDVGFVRTFAQIVYAEIFPVVVYDYKSPALVIDAEPLAE